VCACVFSPYFSLAVVPLPSMTVPRVPFSTYFSLAAVPLPSMTVPVCRSAPTSPWPLCLHSLCLPSRLQHTFSFLCSSSRLQHSSLLSYAYTAASFASPYQRALRHIYSLSPCCARARVPFSPYFSLAAVPLPLPQALSFPCPLPA
jgi:hypothetical protein